MARDRQAAKRRQEQRRQERLARQRGDGAPPGNGPDPGSGVARGSAEAAGPLDNPELDAAERSELAASAPPEETGRSDSVIDAPAPPRLADEALEPEAAAAHGDEAAETHGRERGRVIAFLAAVVAELKRVQWPNRQALTTLTGVVLGFVVIAGAYLGLLDTIFSRLVQALL